MSSKATSTARAAAVTTVDVDTDADYHALGVQPPQPRRRQILLALTGAVGLALVCASVAAYSTKRARNVIPVSMLAKDSVRWIEPMPENGPDAETAEEAGATAAGAGKRIARLRITNGCRVKRLWIANQAFKFGSSTPYFPQNMPIEPGMTLAYHIPDEGLAATRFWAKYGCDRFGNNCLVGESGGPGEKCNAGDMSQHGCAPPVDSKFEGTFGCMPGAHCEYNPSAPKEQLTSVDWWDVSQVDGWTLPYKVDIIGDCPLGPKSIDCSHLSLSSCPEGEHLGNGRTSQSLKLKDTKGTTVGCYSPCAKLTYAQWNNAHNFSPDSDEAKYYCCAGINASSCSAGPVEDTKYVHAVHHMCPNVYAYAYDDGVGLAQCPAGTVYDVTFYCPIEHEDKV